jgi:hypothetical protein
MADINVDVILPAPINVDVTSPTQAVSANVSIPGPQGPRGEPGLSLTLNNLSGNLLITGADGILILNTGDNTLIVSGASGYFQTQLNTLTNNLISTGSGLDAKISSLSGTLVSNYATLINLANTGSTLNLKIDNLSGYVNTQDTILNTKINNLSGLFTGYTGTLDATFATDAQLIATGSRIDILSGNLISTGTNLESKINTLSGNLISTGAYILSNTNSLSGDLISTGAYIVSNINSLSGDLISTGSNLESKINIVSGNLISTGSNLQNQIDNLDNIYATDSQLQSTGLFLSNSIDSLSGTLISNYATITNLETTGSNLQSQINNLDNVYATDASLISTGNALDLKINNLSGYTDSNLSTLTTNIQTTGSTLNTKIDTLSGSAVLLYGNQTVNGTKTFNNGIIANNISGTATFNSLNLTAANALYGGTVNINGGSGVLAGGAVNIGSGPRAGSEINHGQVAINGSTVFVNGNTNSYARTFRVYKTGVGGPLTNLDVSQNSVNVNNTFSISGIPINPYSYAISGDAVLVYGNQSISGNKSFVDSIGVSGTGTFNALDLNNVSSLLLSGTNINITGNSIVNIYNPVRISGNEVLTGVDLSSYATVANLALTGSTLNTKIDSLSGSAVLLYGDQTIDGTKTFRDRVYIHDLYVTGEEFIANVTNNFIESPYILLNLTGGATDGGIFFVTGSGLTGINDLGPIIGFDHTDKFKFGISSRGSDLSTLNDIAAVQDITAYSGFVDGKYATIINLASTGSTLDTKINTLSGYSDNTFATITNLASTGSTLASNLVSTGSTLQTNINTVSSNLISTGNNLEGKISSLSGTLTSTYATISNLASTGATLDSKIDSLSGYSNSTFATITNLASTGSTLNTKIDNLSGYVNSSNSNIVFTTGNQTINDLKTFTSGMDIYSGTNPQSIRVFNSTGTNSGEFGLFGWQNNNLIVGAQKTNSGIFRNLILTGNNFSVSESGAVFISGNNGGITFGARSAQNQISTISTDTNDILYMQAGLGAGKSIRIGDSTRYIDVNASRLYYQTNSSNYFLLVPDGANNLSLRNGTNPNTFRVFNTTGTNSGEFGLVGWQNNQLLIGSQKTNSGILRDIIVSGANINLYAMGDGTVQGGQLQIPYNTDYNSLTFRNIQSNVNYLQLKRYLGSTSGPLFTTIGFASSISTNSASTADLLVERDAAGILAQRNGTNAQQFRVYNITGTNTGEFALLGWQNNNLIIGAQQSQSGTLRDVFLTGRNININASGVFNIFDNTNISGNVNITGNTAFTARPTVNGTGVLLSGEVTPLPVTIVYTTGDQTIGGNKTFTGVTTFSGQEVNLVDTALNLSGVGDMTFSGTNVNFINSPVFISGTNLRVSGDVFANNLVYNTGNQIISGVKTFIGNHIISGNTTVSGSINISGNYDIYSQIENVKKLAIAYAIAL